MKKLLLLALLAAPLYAQTTTVYTGTVRDLNGNAVNGGRITFTLNAPSGGTIPGTGVFVASTVTCTITAAGAVKANDGTSNCTVTNNSALTPTGTSYALCIQPKFVTPGSCFTTFATGGTIDVSTLVPTPTTQPSYGAASTTLQNTWSSKQTFSGGTQVTGGASVDTLTVTGTGVTGNLPVGGAITGGAVATTSALTSGFTSTQAASAKTVTVAGYGSTAPNLGGGTFQWVSSGFAPPAAFSATIVPTSDGKKGVLTYSGLTGTLNLGLTIVSDTPNAFTTTRIVSINSSGQWIVDTAQTVSGVAAHAVLVDGCIHFAPSNDATGNSGVWERQGGYSLTITPEMCGAVGDGSTDDTNAWRRALSLLQYEAVLGNYGRAEGSPRTYLLSGRLYTPVGNIAGGSCGATTGSSTGGDNWEITARGKMTFKQSANDEPILTVMAPCRSAERNAKLSHIKFTWSTQQLSNCAWNYSSPTSSNFTAPYNVNCHSMEIMFDQQGDSQFGPNAWHFSDLELEMGAHGISPSPEMFKAGYAFPLWGAEFDNIRGNNTQTGPYMVVGGFGASGSTRGIIRNFYAQSSGIYTNWRTQFDAGYTSYSQEPALVVYQGDSWALDSIETNLGSNIQIFMQGMTNTSIDHLRFEQTHCTFGGAAIMTFASQTNIKIRGLENKSFHPDVLTATNCYMVNAYQSHVEVSDVVMDNDFSSASSFTASQSGTTLTINGGTISGVVANGATLTIPGFTTEHITGGSGLSWTVDTSQTFSNIAITGANTTTGNLYIAEPNGPNIGASPPVLSGRVTFGGGLWTGSTSAGTLTHSFLYQGGPPWNGATGIGFIDKETVTFQYTGLNASVPNTTPMTTGLGEGTFRAPREGHIVRVEVLNSANVTAGTIFILPTVNGNTINTGISPGVTSGMYTYRMGSPETDMFIPTTTVGTPTITVLKSHFFGGDTIGVNIGTDAGFLPIGQNVTVRLTLAYK